MEVAEILAECAAGDGSRFGELIERFGPRVRYIISRRRVPEDSVDDLQQEVWIKIFRNASSYRGATFPAWLSSIVHSVCLDYFRAKSRCVSTSSITEFTDRDTGEVDVIDRLEIEHHAERVMCKLRSVYGEDAELIASLLTGDRSTSECAELAGRSISTMRWRRAYVKKQLSDFVES